MEVIISKNMSKKKVSSFKKIGYIETLPKNADINNYETLLITENNGDKTTLYRLSSDKKKYDDIINFNDSWDIFNSYLN